ncbi:MAG TPA: pitrilysin family protein [Candidatus Nitrosopolaris sp.]|nr:pitrilysin family protein [Candidatus Nitrosopolaris sp.]
MKHTVSVVQLKNGAHGLFIDIPGATVTSYELNFRAGEYLLKAKNKWEAPHIMEHVILGANEEYPDTQAFQAEFNKNGAFTNAYTSYYYINYIGETADFEWERVLRLQLMALAKPLFLENEFQAEVGNIRDELVSYSNNYFRVLGSEMSKDFGFSIKTDKERAKLIDNVSRQDVIDHYKRTHFSKNMRFIIAGNLRGRRPALRKILESLELPAGKAGFALPNEQAKKPPRATFVPNKTVDNIYLTISSYLNDMLSIREDDSLGLSRIMLTDTLYSKIFGQAREKGLVYAVFSGHSQMNKTAEWWLSAQVLPQNAPALCDIILSEIKKVQNGLIDDASLEAAKQYALGSFQRSMQTVGAVAGAYGRYFFDGYVEDMRSIPERIKAVSKKDMAAVMRRMFSEDISGVGVLGGSDATIGPKLDEQLRPLWR